MENIAKFATEVSKVVGQRIGNENIHAATGSRYYYIQAPKVGAPMLLHHYRGPFFIDIHPDDFENIASGKVSANEYIESANWQIGYYWGGGSMIGGGYYQPFDIVGRKDEVRRYFRILSCRGKDRVSGHMPSEELCKVCFVDKCPFSKYKEGNWKNEMPEVDPRCDLFNALRKRFEQENPGYTLRGFICDELPEKEIRIYPNTWYSEEEKLSFTAYASEEVIQSLLMHENVPEDWENYASSFEFKLFFERFAKECLEVTPENLEKAFDGMDYSKKSTAQPEAKKVPLLKRLADFAKKIF